MQYKIINLEQGSYEWLEFRKGKIGASMVASCVGIKRGISHQRKSKRYYLRT